MIYCTVLYYTILFNCIYCTLLYYTIQLYAAVFYSTIYCTVLNYTIQLYAAVYSTDRHMLFLHCHMVEKFIKSRATLLTSILSFVLYHTFICRLGIHTFPSSRSALCIRCCSGWSYLLVCRLSEYKSFRGTILLSVPYISNNVSCVAGMIDSCQFYFLFYFYRLELLVWFILA